MADAPAAMIEYLMRQVTKLEAENAAKGARVAELEAFLETMREGFQESACDAERYFQLMDGPATTG